MPGCTLSGAQCLPQSDKARYTPFSTRAGDDDDFGVGGTQQSQLNIVRLPTCISSLYQVRDLHCPGALLCLYWTGNSGLLPCRHACSLLC